MFQLFSSSIGPSDYTIYSGLTFTNGTCGLYWTVGSVVITDSVFTKFNGKAEVDEYSGTLKPARNSAKLIVRRSEFFGNTQHAGAAIQSFGATVILDKSSVHDNFASQSIGGSAIYHKCSYDKPCGRITISNSEIYNNNGINYGTTVSFDGGVITMSNTNVKSNQGKRQREILSFSFCSLGSGISTQTSKFDADGVIVSGNGGTGMITSQVTLNMKNCAAYGNQDSGFE